jgi:hypothetical protein
MAEWGINPFMHLATACVHPTPKGGGCRVRLYVPEEGGMLPWCTARRCPPTPA